MTQKMPSLVPSETTWYVDMSAPAVAAPVPCVSKYVFTAALPAHSVIVEVIPPNAIFKTSVLRLNLLMHLYND